MLPQNVLIRLSYPLLFEECWSSSTLYKHQPVPQHIFHKLGRRRLSLYVTSLLHDNTRWRKFTSAALLQDSCMLGSSHRVDVSMLQTNWDWLGSRNGSCLPTSAPYTWASCMLEGGWLYHEQDYLCHQSAMQAAYHDSCMCSAAQFQNSSSTGQQLHYHLSVGDCCWNIPNVSKLSNSVMQQIWLMNSMSLQV